MSVELEFRRKLTKVREELSKKEIEVRNHLANIEKIKVDALKKAEEMKYSTERETEKVHQEILKSPNLESQAKQSLLSEISQITNDIERRYAELRSSLIGRAG